MCITFCKNTGELASFQSKIEEGFLSSIIIICVGMIDNRK